MNRWHWKTPLGHGVGHGSVLSEANYTRNPVRSDLGDLA